MNLIQKDLFNIEYAKLPITLYLEKALGKNFLDIELYPYNSNAILKINIVKGPKDRLPVEKNQLINQCIKIYKMFCKIINIQVELSITENNTMDHPKHYLNLLKLKSFKSNPFTALSKIEKITLPPTIKGLIIRVKGKKGVRKDRKVATLGNPCRHSFNKNTFIKRTYSFNKLENSKVDLGTYGVQIILVKK